MRTVFSILSLPVIEQTTGALLGKVVDALIERDEVTYIVIDRVEMLRKHFLIPIKSIEHYGEDALIVKKQKQRETYTRQARKLIHVKGGKSRLQGLSLLNRTGGKIGIIEDVYFSEETGTIKAYEITEGIIADFLEGRKVIHHDGGLIIHGEIALLP